MHQITFYQTKIIKLYWQSSFEEFSLSNYNTLLAIQYIQDLGYLSLVNKKIMGCAQDIPDHHKKQTVVENKQQLTFGAADFVHEMEGSIYNQYQLISPSLGKGSFGEVFKAIHIKTGLQRAVKTISKSKLKVTQQLFLESQVENLKKLDHPNILKVYEFYQDKDFFYIVTELCTGGELFDKIIENKKFSEHTSGQILKQVLNAIQYCHKHGIVHRDLKPQNLIFESKMPNSTLKIIDFGTSREYKFDQALHQKIGTPYYIAPEVIFGEYNQKCDIWSCGVILYIMLTGVPPFTGKNDKTILFNVSKGQVKMNIPQFRDISAEAKDLIKKMMQKDKDKRFSARECLEHPWFTKFTNKYEVSNTTLSKALMNLKNFKTQSKLQEATWMYLVNILATKEERKQLLKTFKSMDTNQDGELSIEELRVGFSRLYPEELVNEEITRFAKICSKGFITFTEFVVYCINRKSILMDSNLQKVFRMFDKDESKSITVGELKDILGSSKTVGLQIWEDLMREADANSDGSISLDQFKDMMKAILK